MRRVSSTDTMNRNDGYSCQVSDTSENLNYNYNYLSHWSTSSEGTSIPVCEESNSRSQSQYFLIPNIQNNSSLSSDDVEEDGEISTTPVISKQFAHLQSSSFSSAFSSISSPISSVSSPTSGSTFDDFDSYPDSYLFSSASDTRTSSQSNSRPMYSSDTSNLNSSDSRIPYPSDARPSYSNNTRLPVYSSDASFSRPSLSYIDSSRTSQYRHHSDSDLTFENVKYPQYVDENVRLATFHGWPAMHSQTPHEMSSAGLFYTSFADWVRCFCCGIGIKNWEPGDDPWVEHARWSPRCQYVRLMKNETFVNEVQQAVEQQLGTDTVEMTSQTRHSANNPSTTLNMNSLSSFSNIDCQRSQEDASEKYPESTLKKNPLLTDAAQSVLAMGYLPKVVQKAINVVLQQKTWKYMTAEDIMECLLDEEEEQASRRNNTDDVTDVEKLKETNETLKEQTMCKMCCEAKVSIVFLPCGHLVSCAQCAPALRKCPMCRQEVKGTVKVTFNTK